MADVADNVLEFTPWQSVGIFKFDDDVTNYQHELDDWIFEPTDKYGNEHYKTQDDTRIISIYKGKIGSIFCYDMLTHQGVNLIGLTIDEFSKHLNATYIGNPEEIDFEDDGYPQTIYDFEDIGARVWVKQGKIITIIVAGKDSYSDEPCYD